MRVQHQLQHPATNKTGSKQLLRKIAKRSDSQVNGGRRTCISAKTNAVDLAPLSPLERLPDIELPTDSPHRSSNYL
jgi:hypothetical protein